MFDTSTTLESYDPEVSKAIELEGQRQEEHIELIASENYTSPRVMVAQGSKLTNKYAEGYPGKRYYGGCEFVDDVETLAIERAKELFGADYANVQPHSGSQANGAVYHALVEPGDTIPHLLLLQNSFVSPLSGVVRSTCIEAGEAGRLRQRKNLSVSALRFQPVSDSLVVHAVHGKKEAGEAAVSTSHAKGELLCGLPFVLLAVVAFAGPFGFSICDLFFS